MADGLSAEAGAAPAARKPPVRIAGRLLVAAALVGLAAATFYFPGHTWLQSDTQIYAPMLERQFDARVLAADPIATRPHTAWTIYGETAVFLRRATGLSFETILSGLQFVFRLAGVWGLWLLGLALGLTRANAVWLAALGSLGAAIRGPAVLTVEYEPVPRAFAMGALLLAAGLSFRGRHSWAVTAASIATLFHPPTTWPIWPLLFVNSWRDSQIARPGEWWRTIWRSPVVITAFVLMETTIILSAKARRAGGEPLLRTLDAVLEPVLRMRAPYNWVSEWDGGLFWHYSVLSLLAAGAAWRIGAGWRWLIPAAGGAASVPLSWLLLEHFKLAVIPQFQPARAVLWITLTAITLCAAAALRRSPRPRYGERALWLTPVFWIPVFTVAFPPLVTLAGTAAVVALAAAAAWRPWTAAAAFLVIPLAAGVRNYPPSPATPQLAQLSEWALTSTAPEAVFLFADAGRSLTPGVFRAESLRALYADWKSGGQANYFRDYARMWRERWEAARQCDGSVPPAVLASLGVDYVVLTRRDRSPAGAVVFENTSFAVIKVR